MTYNYCFNNFIKNGIIHIKLIQETNIKSKKKKLPCLSPVSIFKLITYHYFMTYNQVHFYFLLKNLDCMNATGKQVC